MSKVLSLDLSSCPQIWNAQKRSEREKEKVGDRPAKLNEKKRDRELEGKKTYTLRVQQFWRGR